MRKLLLGLLGAAALTAGSGANAATVVGTYNSIDSTLLNLLGTEGFGETQAGAGAFTTTYNFTLFTDALADSQISSVFSALLDIDFTSVLLDGYAFSQTSADGDPGHVETWALLLPTNLAAGAHTITVNGNVVGTRHVGSYVGNINIAAVPEPATWAMMLLGFGAVGFAMRRRRRQARLQIA